MQDSSYSRARSELAIALLGVGAVLTTASDHPLVVERENPQGKERGFKLKLHEKNPSAPLSPFLLNFRTPGNPKPGPLTKRIIDLAARCMRYVQFFSGKLTPDAVAGVPRAGEPFAKALADLAGMPCIELEKYEYGQTRCIASLKGFVPAHVRNILVVDDLVTEADSKRETIQVLGDVGMEVTDVMVLVDREQGGREELAGWGVRLHSVFTITELLDLYVETGRMEPGLRENIHLYLKAT